MKEMPRFLTQKDRSFLLNIETFLSFILSCPSESLSVGSLLFNPSRRRRDGREGMEIWFTQEDANLEAALLIIVGCP